MKKTSILFFLLTSIISYSQKDVTINVKAKKSKGEYIYLQKADQANPITIDSAKFSFFGKAKIKTSIQEAAFYQISKNKTDGIPLVLNGGEKISINTSQNIVDNYAISGSYDSELIHKYFGVKNNPIVTSDSLANYAEKFIENNPKSLALFIALGDVNDQEKYFPIAEKGIGEAYPNSIYHKILQDYIKEIKAINQEPAGPAIVGNMAPELNFTSPSGEIITLESLRGKYVLVDFWASWCGPCRRENPNVVNLYNKYKEAGFDIYSVSLDKDKSRWEDAIAKDGLIWPSHVSDLKQWQSDAVSIYGFGGIPYTVLLDKEGRIIATQLRSTQLENKLAEIFGF